jgi:uncharacterized protein Yka (UPF0111/DUF47 family)
MLYNGPSIRFHDALYVLKGKEMYQEFERILDACEDAASTILCMA